MRRTLLVSAIAVALLAPATPASAVLLRRQVACSEKPLSPVVSGPKEYVVSGPGDFSLTVSSLDPNRQACGDRTEVWIEPVELDLHAATYAESNDDVRVVEKLDCDACLLQTGQMTTFPVSLGAGGGVSFAFPDSLGPGHFVVLARTQRGKKLFSFSEHREYLVTDPLYASLDADARAAMLAHAEEKEAAANTSSDPDKLRGDANLLRAMVASKRHFLRYEKTSGGDRLVEVFGELAGARNVAVVVPGLDSDARKGHNLDASCKCVVSNEWVGNAERLWLNAAVANDAETTATIAWLGYDAPRKINVAAINAARNGADELRADLLNWSIPDSKHLTLVGHSYGSTTLGVAMGRGETADDVVYVGSPGVGAYKIDRPWWFEGATCPSNGMSCAHGVGANHGWVARFDEDPVPIYGRAETLGTPPDRDEFGAIEFHTEPPQCSDWMHGYSIANVKCHSHYFSWHYAALENLTRVVLGRYGDVELNGDHPAVPKAIKQHDDRLGWPTAPARPAIGSAQLLKLDPSAMCQHFEGEFASTNDITYRGAFGVWAGGQFQTAADGPAFAYGDIDGDKSGDGAVVVTCEFDFATSYVPELVLVATARGNQLSRGQWPFRAPGIEGPIHGIAYDSEGRELVVQWSPDANDPPCCLTTDVETSFRVRGGELVATKSRAFTFESTMADLVAASARGDAAAAGELAEPGVYDVLRDLRVRLGDLSVSAMANSCNLEAVDQVAWCELTASPSHPEWHATAEVRRNGWGDFTVVSVEEDDGAADDEFTGDGAPPECLEASINGTPEPDFCAAYR